jgi:hypothetical protein
LLSLVFFKPFSLSPSQSLGLTGNFEPRIIAYSKTKSLNDEFKLEEVIAEFERKGIDEKYYKDLGEEGKVKNKAVSQEYKLKINNISKLLSLVFFKPFSLSPSQSLGLTGNFEPRIIAYSKTKSLKVSTSNLFFRLYSTEKLSEHLIKSYEKGNITEDFALEIANIRNATNIPRSHRISNSKIGNMLEVELAHMERAPSAALTAILA